MAEQTFADFIARDRERLHAEREQIFNQQHELQTKLDDINRELSAIDAYEAAKTGKAPAAARREGCGILDRFSLPAHRAAKLSGSSICAGWFP